MSQSWRFLIPFVSRQLGLAKLGKYPLSGTAGVIHEPTSRLVSTKVLNGNQPHIIDSPECAPKERSKQSAHLTSDGTLDVAIPWGFQRDFIVEKFFQLSNDTMRGTTTEHFFNSSEYKSIESSIMHGLSAINTADLTSLVASLLKMRRPCCKLVSALENEMLSRVQTLGIRKIVKLLRFYDSVKVSAEQNDVVRRLEERLQWIIQNDPVHLRDINITLKLVADRIVSSDLLGLLEEKALELLTLDQATSVKKSRALSDKIDYASLCDLFNVLSDNDRRPIPLLRAASMQLTKCSPAVLRSSYSADLVPSPNCLTKTLRSLIALNYHNRSVISRLIDDLNATLKPEMSSPRSSNQLLWALHGLNWRSTDLLEKFYEHVLFRDICSTEADPSLKLTLIQVSAHVNHQPKCGIQDFYDTCLKQVEDQIPSDQWLSYVWSLVALKIDRPGLMESVLTQEYSDLFQQSSDFMQRQSNKMKYLNLRAIAEFEMKKSLPIMNSQSSSERDTNGNLNRQKFVNRIDEAIRQMVADPKAIRTNTKMSHGFTINCELLLDENLVPMPLEESQPMNPLTVPTDKQTSQVHRCAVMYVPIGETLANHPEEVVGHRCMAGRITNCLGYKAVFIPESVVALATTSSELVRIIRGLIHNSVTEGRS